LWIRRSQTAPDRPDHVRTLVSFELMGSSTDDTARRRRIEMRVTAEQETLIRRAASLAHETVTAFVLGTATRRATELVEAERTVTLPNETFDQFYAALDDPATVVPELAELFGAEPLPRS
jgi:uncharacterized protein (DUF1778 family)